jgi:hypothetical protein
LRAVEFNRTEKHGSHGQSKWATEVEAYGLPAKSWHHKYGGKKQTKIEEWFLVSSRQSVLL